MKQNTINNILTLIGVGALLTTSAAATTAIVKLGSTLSLGPWGVGLLSFLVAIAVIAAFGMILAWLEKPKNKLG